MEFGIYVGSATGSDEGLLQGKPDNPSAINSALDTLQGDAATLLARAYLHYKGNSKSANHTPFRPEQYAIHGRKLDLVICYQTDTGDMEDWQRFIEKVVDEYGAHLGALQITEETNVVGHGMDGDYPSSMRALTEGVIAAKTALQAAGWGKVAVGFNVTPTFGPDTYWQKLSELSTPEFLKALDYVGFDFFPDVFRPIPTEQIAPAVQSIINDLRERDLAGAGIGGHVPIRITENGWPTGDQRPLEQQAVTLERIIMSVYEVKDTYNITHYELFQLRDTDSDKEGIFYHFGIMDDEYLPKPAFTQYARLVADLRIQ
ncbi:MAG: hypothetical protein JWL85_655 [Candidatus Saccharibacteria bacterium]|nr:hypothetical protein [Candidatus Saccharibacteria bacterium]